MRREDLVGIARRLLKAEQIVGAHFPGARCVDVSWSTLLAMYASHLETRPLDISGACFSVPAPTSTVLRRLDRLHDLGLIDRTPDKTDGRRTHVSLRPKTIATIEACLRAIVVAYDADDTIRR